MHVKTTAALLLLLACGAGLYVTGLKQAEQPTAGDSGTVLAAVTENPPKRVEITGPQGKVEFQRTGDGKGWVMPGGSRTRDEVPGLLEQLIGLRSRFDPEPIPEGWKTLFDKAPVTVVLGEKDQSHKLQFIDAPESEGDTRFDRPTYVRVDGKDEMRRLAPGLVTKLDRPADYYLRRRLFPSARVPREPGATEKVDRLDAVTVTIREKDGNRIAIARSTPTSPWELAIPYRDALDPMNRDRLLEAVPDLWVDKFLPEDKAKDLKKLGLTEPARELTVGLANGTTSTLLIGDMVPFDPEAGFNPGAGMRYYARLKDSERVFEIRGDKFNDIFVSLDQLRDSSVGRFKAEDVRLLKLVNARGKVELKNVAPRKDDKDKDKDKPPFPPPSASGDWKLLGPTELAADNAVVDKLVSTLATLNSTARIDPWSLEYAYGVPAAGAAGPWAVLPALLLTDKDSIRKRYGLEKPAATLTVTVEEGKGADLKKRDITFRLGRHDLASKKLWAMSDNYERINELSDTLAEEALNKSGLDFREKRVLNFVASHLEKLEVKQHTDWVNPGIVGLATTVENWLSVAALFAQPTDAALTAARTATGWELLVPVKAPADRSTLDNLAFDLSMLRAVAFVGDNETVEKLRGYGLVEPSLRATLNLRDAKPRELLVGRPRSEGGWFARLADAPEVFALSEDMRSRLAQDALKLRPSSPWSLSPAEIESIKIARAGQAEYELKRDGAEWRVTGPFTVTAPTKVAETLLGALREPRVEYRAHEVKDLALYGLVTPAVKVTVRTKEKKEHVLSVSAGLPGGPGRYALTSDSRALLWVDDALARTVDQSALDFLDRTLTRFDGEKVTDLLRKRGKDELEVVKKEDGWRLVKPMDLAADARKVPELLKQLGSLQAQSIAAYQPKDEKEFGLDTPEAVLTLKFGGEKMDDVVLALGKEAPGGGRYVRIKGKPEIGVLGPADTEKLLVGVLKLRSHDFDRVREMDVLKLEAGPRKITIDKGEGTWKLTQPLAADVDANAVEDNLVETLSKLRADELVVEKASDEQLKTFGLDKPALRWQAFNGEKLVLDLAVGAKEKNGPRRYARIAGNDLVFLLDPKATTTVTTEYRPRDLFKPNIDPAQIVAVKFGYEKDGFEIRKDGQEWEVVGKADVRLNKATVSDTLSVMRDLKLERYLLDKDAELKLYGLDPPALVLEVTTETGKQVLHIGGQEGESKRRYARSPRSRERDVGVLDETASEKLFRDLKTLSKTGP